MPSKSQIRRAGQVLRRHHSGRKLASPDSLADALGILEAHRAVWGAEQGPVYEAVELIHMVLTDVGLGGAPIASRLKTSRRIVDKLVRLNTDLSRLQDIGGCRVILEDNDAVRLVCGGILARFPDSRVYDYITSSKPSGYRAIHVVLDVQGVPVEIQIRTRAMHRWATLVEKEEERTGIPFKHGTGDDATLRGLRDLADRMARDDEGPLSD